MLYGGDYNPDQWLDRPDVLKEDIRLMKKAGVTVVSLGIFAWSALEPEEGVFTFEWMDRVIEELHGAGVKVFLATPSGARPVWMARKYPEVLRVNASGQRNLFGARHNHCFSSPVYREKTALMNKKLAERYGNHPAVILWHIS
ncbi:MAG: beta-galactosidase, partial [Spirochaetales bacterium]|nr:beta-galactosidase [Spirochaetales bacterium]